MIRIANRQRSIPLPLESYRILAEKALLRLGQPEAEIGITFISDLRIRSMNRFYRGKDQPTDVLAFSLEHSKRLKGNLFGLPPPFLGDIVISAPTARRQALVRTHSLHREIAWLVIHGLLHLLGYDHERAREARRMLRKEQALLRELFPSRRRTGIRHRQ